MNESEIFRERLLAAIKNQGLTEAEVAVRAGLNRRAVTDIRERRTKSPKLSTVFALAKALSLDPGEMIGLGPRARVQADLAEYLSQYDADEQAQLLGALRALRLGPDAKP